MTWENDFVKQDMLKIVLAPRIIQSQRKGRPVEFSPLVVHLNDGLFKCLDDEMRASDPVSLLLACFGYLQN